MPKAFLAYLGSSFLLHLLWENLQAPLYSCYQLFWQCFWICLRATVTGDISFMLTIYAVLALVHRDWRWMEDTQAYRHPATWVLAGLVGVLLAISFELWAVHVVHRWAYTASMPMLPLLQIGVTPVLQMVIVPLLVLVVASRFAAQRIARRVPLAPLFVSK